MNNHEIPKERPKNYYLGNLQDPERFAREYRKVNQPEYPEFEKPEKKSFKNTAFSRTVRGRNKTGKFIYTALGVAGGVAVGVDLSPVAELLTNQNKIGANMSFEFIDILVWIGIMLITFLSGRGIIKGLLNDLAQEIGGALEALRKARSADSPGGKEITDKERDMLLKEVDDILTLIWRRLIKSRLSKWLGLDVSKLLTDNDKN